MIFMWREGVAKGSSTTRGAPGERRLDGNHRRPVWRRPWRKWCQFSIPSGKMN